MAFEIEGPSGNKIQVTTRGMARTLAVNTSQTMDAALNFERVWTYSGTVTPTGASDYFVYVYNNSIRDVIITHLDVATASAETVNVNAVSGTAAGGTVVTAVNRVVGSGRVPTPGLEVQEAVDITGLTNTGQLNSKKISAATGEAFDDAKERPIVIRPGFAIALLAVAGAIAVNWSLDITEQVTDPVEVI